MKKAVTYLFPVVALILTALFFLYRFDSGNLLKKDKRFTVLDIPVPLPEFTLTDQDGNRFSPLNFRRKWTFMFFGYTNCPDVCPMALSDLDAVYRILDDRDALVDRKYRTDTQFIFVSVDPDRDSPSHLKEYVKFFNDKFIAVTGSVDAIDSIARPMGVTYRKIPGKDEEGDYMIDHSASFLLIDALGRLRAVFQPPHEPEKIATAFITIRRFYGASCCQTDPEESNSTVIDYRKEKK
jgi:protein SCO1/2